VLKQFTQTTIIASIALIFSIGLIGNVYAAVDQSLIEQGTTEAMKAAGYMRDITTFVELCSYEIQVDPEANLQRCVNFTVELNNLLEPLLTKHNAN
jgi:hypothetical protein